MRAQEELNKRFYELRQVRDEMDRRIANKIGGVENIIHAARSKEEIIHRMEEIAFALGFDSLGKCERSI